MLMSSSMGGLMSSRNNRSSIFCSASSIFRTSGSQYESFRWWLYKGKRELSVSVSCVCIVLSV